MAVGNNKKLDSAYLVFLVVGCLGLFSAAKVMGIWYVMGGHGTTQYEVMVTHVETDDFGFETEIEVWEEQFQFGLFPDKGYDGAAPLAGGFGALGLGFLLMAWRRRRKLKRSEELEVGDEKEVVDGQA